MVSSWLESWLEVWGALFNVTHHIFVTVTTVVLQALICHHFFSLPSTLSFTCPSKQKHTSCKNRLRDSALSVLFSNPKLFTKYFNDWKNTERKVCTWKLEHSTHGFGNTSSVDCACGWTGAGHQRLPPPCLLLRQWHGHGQESTGCFDASSIRVSMKESSSAVTHGFHRQKAAKFQGLFWFKAQTQKVLENLQFKKQPQHR